MAYLGGKWPNWGNSTQIVSPWPMEECRPKRPATKQLLSFWFCLLY